MSTELFEVPPEAPRPVEAPKRRSRSGWYAIGVLLLAGAAVVFMLLTRAEVETRAPEILPPLVRTMTASLAEVALVLEARGTVEPETEAQIAAEVAGRVESLSPLLVEGAFFKAGDALLKLDPSDHRVEADRARAALAVREAEAAMAERQVTRWRALSERGVASNADLDNAEMQIGVARASVRAARADLARAELNLRRTVIRAPFDGRVRSVSVDVGDFVARGAPLARLYGTDTAEVRLPVAPEEVGRLGIGLDFVREDAEAAPKVELVASVGGGDASWTGVIDRLEGEIDQRARTVGVVAQIEDPFGRIEPLRGRPPLTPGMFVNARIHGRTVEGAVVIPREALRSNDRVLVLDEDSRLRFRDVRIVQRRGDELVVGDGLSDGDRVCISPLDVVTDGMRVRVAEAETASP